MIKTDSIKKVLKAHSKETGLKTLKLKYSIKRGKNIMIYIVRNYTVNLDDKKAFEIYSDSTCKKLEFYCNYYEMIETLQNKLDELVANGVITYEEAWAMRNDYIAYNEIVEMYNE